MPFLEVVQKKWIQRLLSNRQTESLCSEICVNAELCLEIK